MKREDEEHADLNVTDWYWDKSVSGGKEERPALDNLMEAARQRAIDCVVVWKVDRFARSASHPLVSIYKRVIWDQGVSKRGRFLCSRRI
ncbi:hypothetical protein BSZ35_18200 [Salinibacter sp. 10B]|nr:recombinase family protein [Salinibacter sp. 10B]PQJ26863.1 hypothetical protein BSZ35_18200 [Salinibacter sp. 10B]